MKSAAEICHLVGRTLLAVESWLLRWIFHPLYHLVWPRQCPMCNRVLRMDEEHICNHCITRLPKTEEGCHRDNRLECLFSADDKFNRGAAFCFYPKEHPFRHAIQALKFDSQPELGEFLGWMAAEEWKDSGFFDEIDCLMPLPLHWKRYIRRGYNQAEWIARGISEVTGIPIDTTHMKRIENNSQQSQKSLEERRQLGQIFAINKPEELRGKHVLLIDDVVTSGSTMQRAMAVLHPIYKCHYSIFSLAIAHD